MLLENNICKHISSFFQNKLIVYENILQKKKTFETILLMIRNRLFIHIFHSKAIFNFHIIILDIASNYAYLYY